MRWVALGGLLALQPGAGAQPCETFRLLPPLEVLAGTGEGTVRVVEATGDGRLDLFVLSAGGRTAHAGSGREDGTFAPTSPLPTQALGLLAADLDRNGVEEGALILPTGPLRVDAPAAGPSPGRLRPQALGTGLARARISVVISGNLARFLAYGIVNEGARPGEGSDDGTFIAGRWRDALELPARPRSRGGAA